MAEKTLRQMINKLFKTGEERSFFLRLARIAHGKVDELSNLREVTDWHDGMTVEVENIGHVQYVYDDEASADSASHDAGAGPGVVTFSGRTTEDYIGKFEVQIHTTAGAAGTAKFRWRFTEHGGETGAWSSDLTTAAAGAAVALGSTGVSAHFTGDVAGSFVLAPTADLWSIDTWSVESVRPGNRDLSDPGRWMPENELSDALVPVCGEGPYGEGAETNGVVIANLQDGGYLASCKVYAAGGFVKAGTLTLYSKEEGETAVPITETLVFDEDFESGQMELLAAAEEIPAGASILAVTTADSSTLNVWSWLTLSFRTLP